VITSQPFTLEPVGIITPPPYWIAKGESGAYDIDLLQTSCTCKHWLFRLKDLPEPERRCKHIEAAREECLNIVLNNIKINV
jgi:hypothetical protein